MRCLPGACFRARLCPCRPAGVPPVCRQAACILLALFCCALHQALFPAAGTAAPLFPRLQAGQVYRAEHQDSGLRYAACLRLLDRHFFELSEDILLSGEPWLRRTTTGRWLQVRQGGMLYLHNAYGMSRLLSLGRSRTLYADMPLKGHRSLGVSFRLDTPGTAPVRILGILEIRHGVPTLREDGSGLSFPLDGTSAPLLPLLRGPLPVFVELECRLHPQALEVVRVLSGSSRLPGGGITIPPDLHAVTGERTWLMDLEDGTQASCLFSATSGTTGDLEIASRGLYLRVPYVTDARGLRFSPGAEDRRMLAMLGMQALIPLLDKTRSWSLHGPFLTLEDGRDPLRVLEQDGR